MNGPWQIPDDAHKTVTDREPDAEVIENTIQKSMAALKVFMQIPDDDPDRHFSTDISHPTTHSYSLGNGRLTDRIRNWNNARNA